MFFILAGLAASGKSSELTRAVSDGNFDLFGAEFNSHLRDLRLPTVPVEDYLDTTARISQSTWFHESDILQFRGREFPSESAVVHFELFWALFLGFPQSVNDHDLQAAPEFEQVFRFFLSEESNIVSYFTGILEDLPLGRSNLVVKTLKPDYHVALQRFQAREAELGRTQNSLGLLMCSRIVYDGSPQGELIYESIYECWRKAVLQRSGTRLIA